MPSVAQEIPTIALCKKRRRDEGDGYATHSGTPQIALHADTFTRSAIINSASHQQNGHHLGDPLGVISILSEKSFDHPSVFHQHHAMSPVRRIIPLPVTKKQRIASDDGRFSPQRQQQLANAKLLQEKGTNSRPTTPSRPGASVSSARPMTRCHICFRKPAKKSDLTSFADCQRCGQRTCYVCIRECLGWRPDLVGVQPPGGFQLGDAGPASQEDKQDASFTMVDADDTPETSHDEGHRRHKNQGRNHEPEDPGDWGGEGHRTVVCSQCCVEKGSDGDVVCLGCLPFLEG